jgi:ABC-type glycerol-3-phosphate transport system permease component
MSGPMIATVALFTFMSTWNDFLISLVFTLSRPELRTLAVGMYAFVGQASRDWTLLCAAATISILPIIFIFSTPPRKVHRSLCRRSEKLATTCVISLTTCAVAVNFVAQTPYVRGVVSGKNLSV